MLNWKKTLEKTVALVDFSKVASCFSVGQGWGFNLSYSIKIMFLTELIIFFCFYLNGCVKNLGG